MRTLVVVRGAGDLATGTICKLVKSGYGVIALETEAPAAIRRSVAFSEAVYTGKQQVEDLAACRAEGLEQARELAASGTPAIMVDPGAVCVENIKPAALVDAIIAKKNLGTHRGMAPFTVALGPGFVAGEDVDVVVETKRGHDLGRLIYQGAAAKNSGVPGIIAGYGAERVIHAPVTGTLRATVRIADLVEKGQVIAWLDREGEESVPVEASLTGLLRGLIRDGYPVYEGMKIADIDPRTEEHDNCFKISDKARCIAGGVLEALLGAGVRPC
jgi:xanthine dehydrogenase accessory factor